MDRAGVFDVIPEVDDSADLAPDLLPDEITPVPIATVGTSRVGAGHFDVSVDAAPELDDFEPIDVPASPFDSLPASERSSTCPPTIPAGPAARARAVTMREPAGSAASSSKA